MSLHLREPVIHPTPILKLRPTQMTLGMNEVTRKRATWKKRDPGTLADYLENHMVPVVLGPSGERYLTDHHHLARALYDEGVEKVFVTVIADLSRLDGSLFWNMMDFHGWTHPYDAKGRRRPYAELPKSIKGLTNDPYRSLAGELRAIGGFAKDSTPFSEFMWADFLRRRIKAKLAKADFDAALRQAVEFARSPDADYLPGWCASHNAIDSEIGGAKPKPKSAAAKRKT